MSVTGMQFSERDMHQDSTVFIIEMSIRYTTHAHAQVELSC